MPTSCVNNRLTITGAPERVDALLEQLHGPDDKSVREHLETARDEQLLAMGFSGLVPCPASVSATDCRGDVKLGLAVLSTDEDWLRAYDAADTFADRMPEKYIDTRTRILKRHALDDRTGDALLKAANLFDPNCLSAARAALAAYGETGYFDSYHWSLANWGAHSEPTEARFELQADGAISLLFDTEDRAPLAFYETMAAAHPELMFSGAALDKNNDYAVFFVTDEPGQLVMSDRNDDQLDDAYEIVYGRPRKIDDELDF